MKIFKKKILKLISVILLMVILLNTILSNQYNKVKAVENEEIYMNTPRRITNVFKYVNSEKVAEPIEEQYISYTKNGKEYPIYKLCIEEENINNQRVELKESNENSSLLWKILQYGYPYSSLESIGVNTEDEAYAVTQEAIYHLLGLRELGKYRSDNPDNVTAIYNIKNKIKNNNSQYELKNAEIKEDHDFCIENIHGTRYCTQKFCVDSNNVVQGYNVSIRDFPEDTKIFDLQDNETSNFNDNFFKIAIPKENIGNILAGKITAENVILNSFPLKYIDLNNKLYCATMDKEEKVGNAEYEFIKETNVSGLIAKAIHENKTPKPNAKLELRQGEQVLSEGVTNEEGIYSFMGLYPGVYSIYERDANGEILGKIPAVTIRLLYNEKVRVDVFNKVSNISDIVIENEKKKGVIEVHVLDGDVQGKYLEGVKVDIYNEKDEVIETLTTNENGLATSSRLPIDTKYKVKQKTSIGDYSIDENSHEVQFKENDEVVIVEIKNRIKTNNIRITKVDKDNNDIKLEGVIFGIYDENNTLIEEITTNAEGVAISSNLPINKQYYVKEIKALDNYVLDTKTITVYLKENNKQEENHNQGESNRQEESHNQEEIQEMQIDKISRAGNFIVFENQRIYDLLPKFGC